MSDTILDRIKAYKLQEIAQAKAARPLAAVEDAARAAPPVRGFAAALTRAAAVMQQLGPQAAELQVIFVTVDPERDTPELLREYMAAFHPSFLALTGSAEATQKTADEFRVHYKKVPTGSSYTMDHTALSYLIDRQGRIRVVLRHEQTVSDYTADVRTLLAQPA